MMIAVALILGQ
jgi:hypothetical protein